MSARVTLATAARVLTQLRRDPRTLALLLVIPCVLLALMRGVFDGQPGVFGRVGVPLVGIFPLVSMFLVTSITMLRERTTGTLERLMTLPLGKLDLLAGYALGMALGLCTSALAATEFQAVQFLPAFLLPQLLLCGLLAPRARMARGLDLLSDVLPMTYAYDGLQRVAAHGGVDGRLLLDAGVIAATTLLALGLGAATLRRRTA